MSYSNDNDDYDDPAVDESPPSGPLSGLLNSLTNTFTTLVAIVQTRLELLTTEIQEEVQRAASLLVWAFVALFAAGIGLFLAALAVIFVFWDTHRVLAAVIVTAVFFVIAIGAGLCLRNKLQTNPRMLDATLTELARDRQRLDERLRRRS
ncbi:MAG: phage holin family protein [Steroidobacteraceae bacterium]